MSYDVQIKRVHTRRIEPAEILALIDKDPELELFEDESAVTASTPPDTVIVEWRSSPSVDPIPLLVLDRDGVLQSAGVTPSNAMLQKLTAIAHALDARVIGEEGEDLTDAAPGGPDVEPTSASTWLACLGCSLLGFGLPALLIVWATRRWLCG